MPDEKRYNSKRSYSTSERNYQRTNTSKSTQKNEYVDINSRSTKSTRKPSRKSTKSRLNSNRKIKKDYDKRGLITGIVIAVSIIVLLVGAYVGWYIFFSATHQLFAKNITVSGVSIGGMTMEKAEKALREKEEELADTIKFVVNANDESFEFTKDDFEYDFNTKDVLNEAMEYSEERGIKTEEQDYEIKMTLKDTNVDKCADKVASEIDCEATDAKVTSWDPSSVTFEFEDETNGAKVDTKSISDSLKKQINSGKTSGEVEAEVELVEPKYTTEYLSNNIQQISSFTTTSTNNENGNTNMQLALAACNGSIIEPEDIWSFNSCTGDTNQTSNGYKEAGVIVNGKHTSGVGGGICQASTTIYQAQLLAGMVVVERSCHYYKSSYADAGLDATVDYGNIDLRMMNAYSYQMFLKCYMEGTTLHAEIYSVPNDGWDYITLSSEINQDDYFENGYTATATRTFYKDGEVVDVETLPSSTYYTKEPDSD